MDHLPYPKMTSISPGHAPGGLWVLLEKVHGAQIVVGCDETSVRIGKRKAWLSPEEPFFGWQRLRSEMEAAAEAARVALHARSVRLYGELCGENVQTGIFYSDDLAVLWFDLLMDDTEFISHRELEKLLSPTVPVLARGPRADLDLPVRFKTKVPTLLEATGPETDAEGWVKKPDRRMPLNDRYILKRKIPEFDEDIFNESEAFDPEARVEQEILMRWSRKMGAHPARIASARSKVGEDKALIADEVVLDVLSDLEDTWPKAMTEANLDLLSTEIRGVLNG